MKNKKKTFKTKATTTTITALLPTTTTATGGSNSGNRSAIVGSGISGIVAKYFVTHFRVTLLVLKTGTEKQSREERRPAYSTFSTYGLFCSPENCSLPV